VAEHDEELNLVYSRNAIEFVTVANEFCYFLENPGERTRRNFIETTWKVLVLLYQKAALLPVIEPGTDDSNEKAVSEEDYNLIRESVQARLGAFDLYFEVKNAVVYNTDDSSRICLSEALADIYQDLKDFVSLYGTVTEEVMELAVWECRNNFGQFWGPRLVGAVGVMHSLVFGEEDLDKKEDEKEKVKNKKIKTDQWFISRRQAEWRKP
jgi:hypothetical protein